MSAPHLGSISKVTSPRHSGLPPGASSDLWRLLPQPRRSSRAIGGFLVLLVPVLDQGGWIALQIDRGAPLVLVVVVGPDINSRSVANGHIERHIGLESGL